MRYRKLDANGDYVLGTGADFLVDSPEAVAQSIRTRLALYTGEWALDTSDGTPWRTEVLGRGTQKSYDAVLRARILGTTGVVSLDTYSSNLDRNTRRLTVSGSVTTLYGTASFEVTQ